MTTYHEPAFIKIVTLHGLKAASSYHKKCSDCKQKYYHSFTRTDEGDVTYRKYCLSQTYLIMSNRSGFEVAYLTTTSDIIEGTGSSFGSIAECYESTHGEAVEPQRLEEGYFLLRLLELYNLYDELLSVSELK